MTSKANFAITYELKEQTLSRTNISLVTSMNLRDIETNKDLNNMRCSVKDVSTSLTFLITLSPAQAVEAAKGTTTVAETLLQVQASMRSFTSKNL